MPKNTQNSETDDNRNKGYIKLYRSIFENEALNTEKYNYFQAFVYLLANAEFRDTTRMVCSGKKKMLKHLRKGQLWVSIRFLAKKWHSTQKTVISWLNFFESQEMIVKNSDKNGTVITIVNYGRYNDYSEKNEADNYSSEYSSEYSSKYSSKYSKGKNNIRIYKESIENKKEEEDAPLFSPWGEELE